MKYLFFLIPFISLAQLSGEVVHVCPVGDNTASITFSNQEAGAGVNQTITLNGDFGSEQGLVLFPNANFGGSVNSQALDSQVTWNANQITVEIPDFAGTGLVRVLRADSTLVNTENVTIPYSNLNIVYNQNAYRISHQENYTFQFNQNVPLEARARFDQALKIWICETDMNWFISGETILPAQNDGVCTVSFNDNLPPSVLARTYNRFTGCIENQQVFWYIHDIDIEFNSNFNWNYLDTIQGFQHDFLTVAIHELGHARNLGHIIDNSGVMHFAIASGVQKHNLSQGDIDGGLIQQAWSTTPLCDLNGFQDGSCEVLNNEDFEQTKIVESINLYNIDGKYLGEYKSFEEIENLHLATGIYYQEIEYQSNRIERKKVIVYEN